MPGPAWSPCTNRHHAFSSLNERRLLVALDFEGIRELTSQPFTLTGRDGRRWRKHTPDFAVLTDAGVVLVNVRPDDRLRTEAARRGNGARRRPRRLLRVRPGRNCR